jgi:hypothetical protein
MTRNSIRKWSRRNKMFAIRRRRWRRGELPPAGQWTPNDLGLPSEWACPVQPLGMDGEYLCLLDSRGYFHRLLPSELTREKLEELFMGELDYLAWAFPKTR